ncbi:MAG: MerR family transcriptional regulator [Solirubrobacteraceae bacterium]
MSSRWRIKEFAGRTGVTEVTLRAWERRYGLLDPVRSDGGYRLYSEDDERRVISMQAHMTRGVAAAEAAHLALTEAPALAGLPQHPALIVSELLEAVENYDASRADALLGGAFALGRSVAISDVILPAMREIGERWVAGRMTIAHEHFASHLVERRLMRLAGDWQAGRGRLALLACPSGERHTLGLLCFGVALAERDWRIAYLGADMPLGHVADAAARLQPDAIVLSAIDPAWLTDNVELVAALRDEHRTLIAGAGATAAVAERLRVDRLALDPVEAAAEL